MNQKQVTFFSDGGENIRELQLYLNPQAEHKLRLVSDHHANNGDEANG